MINGVYSYQGVFIMSKELHSMTTDIEQIKQSIKSIDQKIVSIENILEQLYELVSNITVFIDDAEEISDSNHDEDEEDWTPYDDRNFAYNDDNDDEDIGGDDYWSSKQDES